MAKAILESDASGDDESSTDLENGAGFKVNEDFARKFTYNKKREELRQLEDKLGKTTGKRKRDHEDSHISDESSSSTSEDEDDTGELATEALDSEIFATLHAIRSKDPKVYDSSVTFYTTVEEDEALKRNGVKEEKPMYLRDYHRKNLLKNGTDEVDGNGEYEPLSYTQEQEALKRSIVGEMHAAAEDSNEGSAVDGIESEVDGFLVTKVKVKRKRLAEGELDVKNADKDPETFLTKFMSARAWVPNEQSRFQPFDSDDSEEDRRAEEFEEAYNLRFEDPAKSNEKLRTHARDLAAKYSVRREETNPRRKRRETEREKRERVKEEHQEDKARLRKLRIEEVEEKVRRIKHAAGLKTEDIKPEDWAKFVDEEWDDRRWEVEMQQRFGEDYYNRNDEASEDETVDGVDNTRSLKKPKWEDDIDVKDLIPDFNSEEEADFSLSDEEEGNQRLLVSAKAKREHKTDKAAGKKQRRIIEQLVDDRLELETALSKSPAKTGGFRYRNTSPTSFGLSAHDILMADDKQLNQFVGLKKLAAFRDPEKKRKDQKHLGKRARLRKWRKETFGDEGHPQASNIFADEKGGMDGGDEGGQGALVQKRTSGKKKRRRPKSKSNAAPQTAE